MKMKKQKDKKKQEEEGKDKRILRIIKAKKRRTEQI
jgi:hypothetical protein